MPNGCIELIIHLTHDHCELVKEDTWGKSPEFTLIGLQTKPYEVRFNEQVQIFGVRFNQKGFTIFLGFLRHFLPQPLRIVQMYWGMSLRITVPV